MFYLQLSQHLSSALIAGGGQQHLERVAAGAVSAEGQQVSGAESVKAVHQDGSVFEPGESLNQTRSVVTYGETVLHGLEAQSRCYLHTTYYTLHLGVNSTTHYTLHLGVNSTTHFTSE